MTMMMHPKSHPPIKYAKSWLNEGGKHFCQFLGYQLVTFALMLLVTVVLYPVSQIYLKPLVAFIFPLAENNSLVKTLWVTSGMYWLMAVIGYYWQKL
jgi:hypothetical protein